MLRMRRGRRSGFIEPCLPSLANSPPAGPGWIHEIKHDGFRIMARRDAAGVRLITRKGNDVTRRFPLIAAAVGELSAGSCLIDGEAIVTNDDGLAVFDLIRRHNAKAVLAAFDLIELDGEDLRRTPIEQRKDRLLRLTRGNTPASRSMLTTLSMARSFSKIPASLAVKALCRSALARTTAPVASSIGSRSRTRWGQN